jgi:uncharacterized protein YoxC
MEQITNILTIFVLLSVTILAIVCVMFILKAQKALQDIMKLFANLSKTVQRIEEDSKPVFTQLELTLQDTSTTMKSLQKQMTTVEGALESIKQIADRVNDLEAKLQAKIEKPVMQAAGFVSGITNAIETFISEFKK